MGLIKKFNELTIPSTIKMMVYGQAGAGKSSFALSAPRPLLLDFDNGVKRVHFEHVKGVDTVQVQSWTEVLQVLQEDLSAYGTIVVDTIGKMMDYIITYKCGNAIPQIRDWNGINAEFSTFIRAVSNLNKHVIFVAHRDTRKEGDATVFIPALREKSYNSVVTELDLLGYMETKTENGIVKRTITFDPTPRNDGKNTCSLPSVMIIPEIIDRSGKVTAPNDMVQRAIIALYEKMLSYKQEERKKYDEAIELIRENVDCITDALSATEFVKRIDSIEHVGSSKAFAKSLLVKKAAELGIKWNAEAGEYEAAKEAKAQQNESKPSLL